MPYLLDADWAINALAGRPQTVQTLQKLAPEGIAISLVTVGEIYEGAFGFPDSQMHIMRFRQWLAPFRLLTLEDAIMLRFAEIRSSLRKSGQLIPDFDLLLASTALHHNLTVLTFNYKHLQRIPSIQIYRPG
ncbi:MAG: type II toxin-antitoxin system VapC family toxin [Anaerolineae bacterium]